MKGFIISAPATGVGKTTITLGLLAALRARGISVQPFKVGPDFIDTGLHEIAAGVISHNLDGWMLTQETNASLFDRASAGKRLSIVEGVMGLYDGFDGLSERGSTAEMAKWLDLPVVLVIDAHAMARSAAAIVNGLRSFDPKVQVAGLIFNRVGGAGHYRILADAVGDLPILGWLPINPAIEIPERHLGLFTAREMTASRIGAIGEFVVERIDLDFFLRLCAENQQAGFDLRSEMPRPERPKRVAIAHDKAFSFYYEANRMALQDASAEIVEFSPLADREVPESDLLYLGGGYPELYRYELETNSAMRASVRRYIESGKRFYAECGGLMYLAEAIDGAKMVGILPTKIEMTDRLVNFGYCEIATRHNSLLGPAGTIARGHQFHYSRATRNDGDAYTVSQGEHRYNEGFLLPNGIASYVHLHFLSNPALARNMLHS
jgi:cobyrinic acid a,c-diamide synthase